MTALGCGRRDDHNLAGLIYNKHSARCRKSVHELKRGTCALLFEWRCGRLRCSSYIQSLSASMSIYRGRTRRELSLASALYDAIQDNDHRGVLLLLEKGADANVVLPGLGISSFHLIIGDDSDEFALKVTKLILQHDGNPNIQSDEGLTPMHIAAAWGRMAIVELLLNCGGNPEIRDSDCRLPIDYAIDYNHKDIADLLRFVMLSELNALAAQENEDYRLMLDRVIIKNGVAEAEYEVDVTVDKDLSSGISSLACNLQRLPKTSPDEYVKSWCRTHAVEKHSLDSDPNKFEREERKLRKDVEKVDSHDSNFSSQSNGCSSPNLDFVNCRPRFKNKNVIEIFSLPYESSSKYRLRREKKSGVDVPTVSSSFCKFTEHSRESGIMTIIDMSQDSNSEILNDVTSDLEEPAKEGFLEETTLLKHLRDTSSDYFTCNEISGSTNILEKNIFGITSFGNESVTKCSNSCGVSFGYELSDVKGATNVPCDVSEFDVQESVANTSLISITEVYKYTDIQEGVELYEERLIVNPTNERAESCASVVQSQSSKLSSLPATFDYDTDTLRRELTACGFQPGPITKSTKRVYLKKLHHLKKRLSIPQKPVEAPSKVYSSELQKTIKDANWTDDLSEYKTFEEILCREFNNPDPSRKWREGINKFSFTYLLLDPRITANLPCRAEKMTPAKIWQTFVSSIFYVGKGKRNRPYAHLNEAVAVWKEKNVRSVNRKQQQILDIWADDFGVVCLHVFQNIIPAEAYTREAAMISALKVENVKNMRAGEFYGVASTWSSHQQNKLGVLLLYKAMLIFLNEGERQLRPVDIK